MSELLLPPALTIVRGEKIDLVQYLTQRGVEIAGVREGDLVDGMVPVSLVDNEEVPVKEDYVQSLVAQMDREAASRGGVGQLSPVILGLIQGQPKLKIIDGFHRSAAQAIRGATHIYSTSMHTDWDGLYDTRIFTAKDHAQVRFSRVVIWMKEIWSLSELSQHLSLEQAVLLQRFDTSGEKLGLDPEITAEAKAWVSRKEVQWDIAALTIRDYIKISDTVDPALVEATREKRSGRELTAPTQDMIKVFSQQIPNNHELQNMIFDEARNRNLKTALVRAVCEIVAGCQNNAEAARKLKTIDWKKLEPSAKKHDNSRIFRTNDPRYAGARTLENAHTDITKTIERTTRLIESGEPLTPEMRAKLRELQTKIKTIEVSLGRLGVKIALLQDLPDTVSTEIETPPSVKKAGAKASTSPSPVTRSSSPRVTTPARRAKRNATTQSRFTAPVKRSDILPRSALGLHDRLASYEEEVVNYLNGHTNEPPTINGPSDARQIENILVGRSFGDTDRAEELREVIREKRRNRFRDQS